MGQLIKKAREDLGYSQAKLADHIYRRGDTITDLENWKHEADATTLAFLAAALDKPILYFYPMFIRTEIKSDDLSPDEKELII